MPLWGRDQTPAPSSLFHERPRFAETFLQPPHRPPPLRYLAQRSRSACPILSPYSFPLLMPASLIVPPAASAVCIPQRFPSTSLVHMDLTDRQHLSRNSRWAPLSLPDRAAGLTAVRWSYRGSLASQSSTCPPDGIASLTDKRQRYSASKRPQGKRTIGSGNEAANPVPTPYPATLTKTAAANALSVFARWGSTWWDVGSSARPLTPPRGATRNGCGSRRSRRISA